MQEPCPPLKCTQAIPAPLATNAVRVLPLTKLSNTSYLRCPSPGSGHEEKAATFTLTKLDSIALRNKMNGRCVVVKDIRYSVHGARQARSLPILDVAPGRWVSVSYNRVTASRANGK